ncbi:MAG: sigma-70 family RNA polymerase sigma factor [Pirellulaceae bacterium]|nr:sigma-70 family RNA polymerase sigma factor [Pirellulaceae bacterium]
MWPNSDKTEELLLKAQEGDSVAINNLLDRHRDSLHRLVQMRLDPQIQQRVDVSDIVQEVLIGANQRLQAYLEKPSLPFHLWLRHMAKDRLIDAHRKHRLSAKRSVNRECSLVVPKGNDASTAELLNQISDQQIPPDETATYRELAGHFEAAIATLEKQDEEIIIMRHFEELSNQEVATALNLTAPAASMRYLRAMKRLRKQLATLLDDRSQTT